MNYLKIAWRNLLKHKGYSFIYIFGLAVGLGVVVLDGLWIYDEITFNQYHKNYERIAQVMHHDTFNGERLTLFWNPYLMGNLLRTQYGDDFKQVVMSTYPGSHVLSYDKKNITSMGSLMDKGAASMLSLEMAAGSQDGLTDPNTVLISESTAKAMFGGTQEAYGKALLLDNMVPLRVSGVYRDIPRNSDFKDQAFIASWDLFVKLSGMKADSNVWNNSNYLTYVQLADHVDMATVSAKIKDLKRDNLPKAVAAALKPEVFLHPMSRWHLYSEFKNGVNTGGRIQFVRLFALVGLFVLLQACINFVNLTTARAQNRAKEIGIRKTIGSLRSQLIMQFFFESVLIAVVAFLFAVLFSLLFLPFFNQISGKSLSLPWVNPWFWLISIAFSILVGLVAGTYPAIYLSSFNPVHVLKGTFKTSAMAILQRKGLVVLQFTISAILIIGTIVVFRQIQYGKDRDMGYNANRLITIAMTPDIKQHFHLFRTDLLGSGAASEVAESANSTLVTSISSGQFDWQGKNPGTTLDIPISNVSSEYGKTIGWKIKEGRDFSAQMLSDSSAFVLNEAAVKFMGLKNPVGKTIQWKSKPYQVIGVIQDIIFESPYQLVRPYIYQMTGDQNKVVTIKLNPALGMREAVDRVASVYERYNPDLPFDFQFTDLAYNKKFGDEVRIGRLAAFFAVLAIFISCLGIFGLSTFIAEQRMKEFAIRKVLGGSSFSVLILLSKSFNGLTLIAFLIGSPVAYFFGIRWLQSYTYHTGISWWIFPSVALGLLLITSLTVSYHSIRVARTNPVKKLRAD